jgi:hypothetical protein
VTHPCPAGAHMSKVVGFIVGAALIVVGILTGNPR